MGCLDLLLFRFNRVFNVSKGRAAVVAILCFIGAFVMLPLGTDFSPVYGAVFVYGLIYGCIWFYKFNRDRKIVEQSKLEAKQYQSSSTTARPRGDLPRWQATGNDVPGRKQIIEITSPGSSRLFVPPPLDRPQ